jgi:hypothetical protein
MLHFPVDNVSAPFLQPEITYFPGETYLREIQEVSNPNLFLRHKAIRSFGNVFLRASCGFANYPTSLTLAWKKSSNALILCGLSSLNSRSNLTTTRSFGISTYQCLTTLGLFSLLARNPSDPSQNIHSTHQIHFQNDSLPS